MIEMGVTEKKGDFSRSWGVTTERKPEKKQARFRNPASKHTSYKLGRQSPMPV